MSPHDIPTQFVVKLILGVNGGSKNFVNTHECELEINLRALREDVVYIRKARHDSISSVTKIPGRCGKVPSQLCTQVMY